MKKLICIIMALLCLPASVIPCCASSDVIFTVFATQEEGENITVDINVSKDSALYTTEFYILYNANDVKFAEGSEKGGDIVKELDPYITATEIEPGKVKVSYTSTKPLDSAGLLCRLEFRAKTTGYVHFNIEVDHAESFDGEEIYALTTQSSPGSVSAKKQASPVIIAAIAAGGIAVVAAATLLIVKKQSSKKATDKKKKSK
ncbi:MAG: hypothetical protein IIW48_03220 [Clostridia bacterium]|nr:hypothetical protein [Clostridia bacterium]